MATLLLHTLRPLVRLGLAFGLAARFATVGYGQTADAPQTLRHATVVALGSGAASGATPEQRLDTLALRRCGVTSTADALRRLAGVNLRDYGGAGGLKTVSVRGLGAAHTAVVYDGVVQSDAQRGAVDVGRYGVEHLAEIALRTQDGGALLCPVRELAAAAVVLTTFLPDTSRLGLHGRAALHAASWGTWHPTLLLAQALPSGTAYNLAADFAHARNDYPFTLPNGAATTTERREGSQTNDWLCEANVRQALRGGQLDAKAAYTASRRYLPGPVTYYVNESTEHLRERHAFLQGRWQQRFGALRYFAAAKGEWQESRYRDRDAQYPGGLLRQDYRQREAYASAGAAYAGRHLEAALAADYALADLSSNLATDNDVLRHTLLAALSLRYTLAPLELTARLQGALYRNHAAQAAQAARNARRLSPTLAALCHVLRRPRLTLDVRTAYKELFRPPTFTENYYYHLGSTTLRPERTRQWGAGLALHALPTPRLDLRLTADAYLNRVSDKISSIPYNLFVWRTVNLGQVRCRGLDATLAANWQAAPRHRLVLNAAYSLLSARDHTPLTPERYGKQLAYTPRHSGSASVAWENPWLSAVVSLTAAAHRWATNEHTPTTRLPAYADLGLALYRSLSLGALGLDLRADLLNVLDRRYEIVRRYPMPGRAWQLHATLSF